MKKVVLSLIFAIFMLVFTGCSCSDAALLSFENLWGGKTIGYKESLTYSVAYSSDFAEFGYSFAKSPNLEALSIEISGTYTIDNEILSKEDPTIPQAVKNNEIFKIESPSVIKSTAKLELTASYSLLGKTQTSNDHIYTTAYFYNEDYAFAPIYTEREINYGNPYVSGGEILLNTLKGEDFTEYSSEKYTVRTNYGEATETEYKYTYKSLIDNSALFMALRNKNIDKDATYSVPTVSPAYGNATTLNLKHFDNTEKGITFTYNGEEKTLTFNTRGISFVVNSLNSSGTPQLVFVQEGEKDGINKSLIVNYVAPLIEYGSLDKYGALVYTLTDATYA